MNDFFKSLFGTKEKKVAKPAKKKRAKIDCNGVKIQNVPKVKFFQITNDSLVNACQLAKACGLKTIFTDKEEYLNKLKNMKNFQGKNTNNLELGVLIAKEPQEGATIVDIVDGEGQFGNNYIMAINQTSATLDNLISHGAKIIAFVPKDHKNDFTGGFRKVSRLYMHINSKKTVEKVDQMGLLQKLQGGSINLLDLQGMLGSMDSMFENPMLKKMMENTLQKGDNQEKMKTQLNSLKSLLNSCTHKELKNPKLLEEASRIARIKKNNPHIKEKMINHLSKLCEQLNKAGATILSMLSNPSKMANIMKNLQAMMPKKT